MVNSRKIIAAITLMLCIGLVEILPMGQAAAEEKTAAPAPQAAPQQKPAIAKLCLNCHQAAPGNLRGNFDGVAPKAHSIQIKIDDAVEILKFNTDALKVVTAEKTAGLEALKDVKRGHEIRIEYTEKDGVKSASLVSIKPPIKVAPEKLMTTAEVEKLVAMGPDRGKYTLVDARPAPRFQEGAIPTAINIPYPAFDKMADKLPKDKNALLVFYCSGMT